jgi:hypothetical protein
MEDLLTIDFSTSDDWWVSDLAAALDSLDQIYNVLALARFLGRQEKENLERRLRQAEESAFTFRKMGPDLEILFHELARALRRAGPAGLALLPTFGFAGLSTSTTGIEDIERELAPFLADPNRFLARRGRLKISKIEMASPGGFSLEGLGEPIKQVRELIKDLCYRNRQEREMGDLELLQKKLAIAGEHNLSPQQLSILATNAIEHQEYIATIVEEGRLALTSDNSPPTASNDNSAGPGIRRTRRRKKSS